MEKEGENQVGWGSSGVEKQSDFKTQDAWAEMSVAKKNLKKN